MRRRIHMLRRLFRLNITLLVGASALFGSVLKQGMFTTGTCIVTLGAMLLSAGCSAWNQAQEGDIDRIMTRTRNRPVPSGHLSIMQATLAGTLLVCGALATFSVFSRSAELMLLAAITIILYNGIYTNLKRITPLALLVGAVMGSFPPVFGWISAGGSPSDQRILIIAAVFYLWQTPHFWLLVDRHRTDYIQAGLPQLFQQIPENRYHNLVFLWITAYFASILLIPLFLPLFVVTRYALILLAVGASVVAWRRRSVLRTLFPLINASILIVILLTIADRLIHAH